MSNFIKKAAMGQANKHLRQHAGAFAPQDPLYDERADERGRVKRTKRDLPPGLTKQEERILRKVKRRAHRLDKGISLCGWRVGYTFFLSLVPVVGDVADMCLNYFCVVRIAKRADIPPRLLQQMLANNAVSASFSLLPIAGDIFLGVWRANSRNSALLEAHLAKRGQERLAGNAGAGEGTGMKTAPHAVPATTGGVPQVRPVSGPAEQLRKPQATPVSTPAPSRQATRGRKWWGGRKEKAAVPVSAV